MAQRPLSPHLGVYKLPLLPLVSIITRICAVALSIGILVFGIWLISLGYSSDSLVSLTEILVSPVGVVLLVGWTFAFMWHSANGVRHLFWDAGHGFSLTVAERSAYAVIIFSIVGTSILWSYIWSAL